MTGGKKHLLVTQVDVFYLPTRRIKPIKILIPTPSPVLRCFFILAFRVQPHLSLHITRKRTHTADSASHSHTSYSRHTASQPHMTISHHKVTQTQFNSPALPPSTSPPPTVSHSNPLSPVPHVANDEHMALFPLCEARPITSPSRGAAGVALACPALILGAGPGYVPRVQWLGRGSGTELGVRSGGLRCRNGVVP